MLAGEHPGADWRLAMRVRRLGCWLTVGATVVVLGLCRPAGAEPADALLDAVKRADNTAVRTLLTQRIDVNQPGLDGTTALHWAVHRDSLDLVDLLIRAGAQVNAANRYGVAPLSLACENGNAVIAERLLEAGADANAVAGGDAALLTAARTGNVAVVKALLAHGASVNATESWRGQSALMWAAIENNAAAATALVEAGADLTQRSKGGFTALLFAIRSGRIAAVRALLDAGANVNETMPDGTSGLVLAIINAHYELAAVLVDRGADANADGQGWTPLIQVAWSRRPNGGLANPSAVPTGTLDSAKLVERLLAHGADPNGRLKKDRNLGLDDRNNLNRVGATPFLLAAKSGDVELMRILVAHGADPRLPTIDHSTPLMAAAGVGVWNVGESAGTNEEALEAVKLALALGGDVNAANDFGYTALHGATHRGANAIVQLLADNGARIDAPLTKDGPMRGGSLAWKAGWTPLTIAQGVFYAGTFKRQLETAQLLRELMTARGLPVVEQADSSAAPGAATPGLP
jgi:ankyrin repeat protein